MAIDRAARARHRKAQRAAHQDEPASSQKRVASAALEVEGLFTAGARHRLDQLEWVAVAKEDDRQTGSGPLDLDSGVVRFENPEQRS